MSLLSQVTKGKIRKPRLVLMYGTDGVGKSTFGAEAPSPIFLGHEQGTDHLDVSRFPATNTWPEVLAALDALVKEAHSYKTLVVDSLDWLEPILFAHIIKDDAKGVKTIETACGGYGKGYVEAMSRWQSEFISRLNLIRAKGMNVVLIAHSDTVNFHDPQMQVEYKRYELKLHKKASSVFREYVDAVLFANYETFVKKEGDAVRTYGDGARIIHTERRPGYDAKNRYGLPTTMALSWKEFDDAADAGQPESAQALKQRIEGMKTAITDPDMLAKIDGILAKAGDDVPSLIGIANRLAVITGEQSQ